MRNYYFILCILFLTACDQPVPEASKVFWVDNPTNAAIDITIDDQLYTIPANSGINADLLAGQHQLTYNNQSIRFFVKPNEQACVINPTLNNYIFYTEIYREIGKAEEANAEYEKLKTAYLHEFVLQTGDTILVPFRVTNDLFIEQYEYYWHLNVVESYKEHVTIRTDKNYNLTTAPQSKLFRENDFFEYIGRENLPEGFVFTPSNQKLSDLSPYVFISDNTVCDCQPVNGAIEAYRARFDSLLMTDAANYRMAFDDFRRVDFLSNLEKECSPRYNKTIENNNFDSLMVAIGKRKEELGMKNAIIIK
ncbi:hypothetical protein [Dysgonomonas sp. ZJ279]|uniref:hypothetical protein n=1 Tax=Dysgonomonas sp. ZJ279 TaxID=2709796 RepID=UPI0013ED5046|nr:hypothetical protein [Dysgonomonas sp. ZJ279]